MNWYKFKKLAMELYSKLDNEEHATAALSELKALVSGENSTPYHLEILIRELQKVSHSKQLEKDQVRVLDHGCGGCLTIIYLMLIGYKKCWGVDLNFGHSIVKLNALLRKYFKIDHDAISAYAGDVLPYSANSFDFIFSQQVLEHVNNQCLDTYMSEEQRVLSSGGAVYHQIPQRLTPWDSHTRLWLVHYFPLQIRSWLYKKFKQDPSYVELILNFKSKFFYIRNYRRLFGDVKDLTRERILTKPNPKFYEGNFKLRSLITAFASLPLIGNVLAMFVMTDMLAKKSR
jgi:SAM-dependent methyltransferase